MDTNTGIATETAVVEPPAVDLSQTFNAAANGIVDARLCEESLETVEALRQQFFQKIHDFVDKNLPEGASESLRTACIDYCIAASRARKSLKKKEFAEIAARDEKIIKAETETLLTPLTDLERDLEEKLKTPEEKIAALEERITSLKEDIKTPEEKIAALEERITSLKKDTKIPEEEIAALEGTITDLEAKIEKERKWYKPWNFSSYFGREDRLSLEGKQQDLESLKAQLKPSKTELKPFETELRSLKRKLELSNTQLKYLEMELESLKREKDNCEAYQAKSLDALFGDEDRLYFRLEDFTQSPIQSHIASYLEAQGYTIDDYAEGYAKDSRGNRPKIGKLLKDVPILRDAFQADPCRTTKTLRVVISRDPVDIARGSYGRGWSSCRASLSSAVSSASGEISEGVIAAYLIREDDVDIHNPLSRIYLKPYDAVTEGDDDTIYLPFNPIGLHHPAFLEALTRFAEECFNKGKSGQFQLRRDCESYREMRERHRLPKDTEDVLKALNADFRKEDGQITVRGNLKMSDLGLTHLPDLHDVIVEGGIDCSGNKLLSLDGLPEAPLKWLNASRNLLITFAGCTRDVGKEFSYQNNPFLVATNGAPTAGNYVYGYDLRFPESDKICIGPLEQPDKFPRFKRK